MTSRRRIAVAAGVLAWTRAPLQPAPGIRAAIAIGGLVAAGISLHLADLGVLAGLGALWAVTQDGATPLRRRVLPLIAASAAAALGVLIGQAAYRSGETALLGSVMVAAAVVAGVIGPRGAVGSGIGLLLLLGTITGGGMVLPDPVWSGAAAVLVGGLTLTVLSASPALWDPYGVERAAQRALRRAIRRANHHTGSVERCRQTLFDARLRMQRVLPGESGQSASSRRQQLIETATALDHDVDAALDRLDAHAAAAPGTAEPVPMMPGTLADTASIRAMRRRPRWALPRPLRVPVGFAVAVAVAYATGLAMHSPRPYWVPLGVAFIFKPEAGAVFARAVNRCIGTLVGAAAAAVLVPAFADAPVLAVLVLAVLGAIAAIGAAHHFAVATAAFTATIFVFLDFLGDHRALFGLRVFDTVLAAVLALIAAALLTRNAWRGRAVEALRDAVRAVFQYDTGVAGATFAERHRLRRRADVALADAATAITRAEQEPPFRAMTGERTVLGQAGERYRSVAVAARGRSRHDQLQPPAHDHSRGETGASRDVSP